MYATTVQLPDMLVLASSFPELKLKSFPRKQKYAKGHWGNINNLRTFFDSAAPQLNIKELKDWYFVSKQQVIQCGGGGLLNHYNGSLVQALQMVYPEYEWIPWKSSRPHHIPKGKTYFGKAQYLLYQYMQLVSYQCMGKDAYSV